MPEKSVISDFARDLTTVAQMAQERVQSGIQKKILLDVTYLNLIVRADSLQYIISLSTSLSEIPLDKVQDLHYLGNVTFNKSRAVISRSTLPCPGT